MKRNGFKRNMLIAFMAAAIMVVQPFFAQNAKAIANTYYDSVYYNTGILTEEEWDTLEGLPVGTVIIMSSRDNEFYYGEEAEEYVIAGLVDVVSMAGVGSSSIGTAAFAKHIATAREDYVAGIVTGLGAADVGEKGIEGYFIGRPSNVLGVSYTNTASEKLAELYNEGARPRLLIGHSKGNMDLANALYMLREQGKESQFEGVNVITFGCGVNVPGEVGSIKQYLGNLDSLGMLNTVSYYNLTWVYGAYHTTNPYYFLTYMPIQYYVVD